MKKHSIVWSLAAAFALSTFWKPSPAPAQSIWIDRGMDKAIFLEVLKPSPKGPDNLTFMTSTWFLSSRFPLTRGPMKVLMTAEIPFANGGTKTRTDPIDGLIYPGESQSTFGNPYLGVELKGENSPFSGEFGLRPPVVSAEQGMAWEWAELTDWDRLDAFEPYRLIVVGKVNFRHGYRSGLLAQVRVGPTFFVPTKSGLDLDPELFADYSMQLGYEVERFGFLGGFTGRTIITTPGGTFAERTIDQLGLSANIGLGKVRPGLHFRVPLDEDLGGTVNFVVGINLAYELP